MRTAEHRRLRDSERRLADWKNWGPYVSDRAWGTVREDYSPDGSAWEYFPHDHARSRAYRWNEDGIGGVCNRFQNVCLAVVLWNERDPILKERFFGVTGTEGNHGEDVKEYYFHLDNVPSHAYMKMLYKYPQVEYPYRRLVEESRRRSRFDPEFELVDAIGEPLLQGRYFDVFIEYAKADEEDILCRITAINRGPDPAPLHLLPHIWFRNTWSWGHNPDRPRLDATDDGTVRVQHRHLGERWWYAQDAHGREPSTLLFTENDTNYERLFGTSNPSRYVKDGINDAVVHGQMQRVNPERIGSKAAAHFLRTIPPGESYTVRVRFSPEPLAKPFEAFEACFARRIEEADKFYAATQPPTLPDDEKRVQRQAFAGLLWTKQFYHYSVRLWLNGDPEMPKPPASRRQGRNVDWEHVYDIDVLSMPDKWEYPWFAAWDLAFHTIPLVMIDPEWAKRQLILLLREWYTHPNGQIPAYEWNFGDVNPPVHAWAAWHVYQADRLRTGRGDTAFLKRVFHKLLLNFTWWVNRKDRGGNNVFQGGFLGLDNIGVFDRSAPLPTGGYLEQADGTSWMAMYCLNMLAIALELAMTDPAYEDVATKFFEHFIYIAHAIVHVGGQGLWDAQDGFFYDLLHLPDDRMIPLKLRSFVGLIPLFAVETIEPEQLEALPRFRRRMEWFVKYRPSLVENIHSLTRRGECDRCLLSIVDQEKLERILRTMFDSSRFLSDYGLRSLSKEHEAAPYRFSTDGVMHEVRYEPGESTTELFGGNSNWRGPIWFPLNYLMIHSLRKYHHYYGDSIRIEVPCHSGQWQTLDRAADDLCRRLVRIFTRPESGGETSRPAFGECRLLGRAPHWRDHLLFHEYFHGDTGAGLGASHQTGWTALVATLIQELSGDGSIPD